ncbi:hypothetical protein OXPF_12710 [Oxobacter pfennigii]|uniref:DUF1015 domain-containing protein n=1 Tax=Oxobacter pfennigii TaxID=36849 RepID=A0A0N8NTL2_9CLOT|nr:DUF1015 family protein [Oxobacter pfennigii]KPU45144.1 hypothetical protein OXPF_12710 [Oxobacter pfennigii]
MAIIKSFKAIRPETRLAEKVAALPYDVMDSNEARKMVTGNEFSFLHVDKAEIDLEPSVDIYDKSVYEKARDNLYSMIDKGILNKDQRDNLYIYRLVMDGRAQTGLVACTSIDDYMKDVIKKHEHTRADKEKDRINHVDYCNANTGPIFMLYRAKARVNSIIDSWTSNNKAAYDFVAEDNVSHTIWAIDNDDIIKELADIFKGIDYLYIADGHHRAASAVKVGLMRRDENPDYDGSEEFNYFLSVLFPDEQLYIMDYNRVVKDLNGLTDKEFLIEISEGFYVDEYKGSGQYKPACKHTFGMYLSKRWYILTAKEKTFDENHPVDSLDVSILQNNLLNPILGIEDPRTDKRIDFVGGIRGLKELERRVEGGYGVAFSMYPTTISDLMAIADAGMVMPPKSTWFEPKLRSGLFIHELK